MAKRRYYQRFEQSVIDRKIPAISNDLDIEQAAIDANVIRAQAQAPGKMQNMQGSGLRFDPVQWPALIPAVRVSPGYQRRYGYQPGITRALL